MMGWRVGVTFKVPSVQSSITIVDDSFACEHRFSCFFDNEIEPWKYRFVKLPKYHCCYAPVCYSSAMVKSQCA